MEEQQSQHLETTRSAGHIMLEAFGLTDGVKESAKDRVDDVPVCVWITLDGSRT